MNARLQIRRAPAACGRGAALSFLPATANVCSLSSEGSPVDTVDLELDRFITKRHDRRVADEGERPALEAWMESERRYDARRRRKNRALWFAHFCRMADSHARIAQDYERRAEALCEEGAA